MSESEEGLTPADYELLYNHYCYYCGSKIEITYTGIVFNEPNIHPRILNIDDGLEHNCSARQACGRG